jgi:hypothetical protein
MGSFPTFIKISVDDEYFLTQCLSSPICAKTRPLQVIARKKTKSHDPTYWPVVFGIHACEKIMVARFAVFKVIIVPDIVLDIPDTSDIAVEVGGVPVDIAHSFVAR